MSATQQLQQQGEKEEEEVRGGGGGEEVILIPFSLWLSADSLLLSTLAARLLLEVGEV